MSKDPARITDARKKSVEHEKNRSKGLNKYLVKSGESVFHFPSLSFAVFKYFPNQIFAWSSVNQL